MDFKIDKEFKALIPPLSPDEYLMLEKECVDYGIRDALVVGSFPGSNGLVLIDGHNRYEISKKNNLSFKEKRLDFSSREDARNWIIRNQLGRRNIPKYVRGELILRLKPVIAEKAKEQQIRKSVSQKSVEQKPIDTQKELAKLAGVSHDTIHKVEKIQAEASEGTKQKLRNGDISINHAFNNLPSQRNKNIVKEATRQAQKEHLEYLEEKARGTVSIESAKREKDNARLLSYETKDAITKLIQASRTTNLIITTDSLRQMLTVMSKYERDRMIGDLSSVIRTVVSLQKKIAQEGEKNG